MMQSQEAKTGCLSEEVISRVEVLLGREPRGLEEVAVWDKQGEPSVIRVASLVDDTPFPTMYWLVDKYLNYQIDRVEARGLIKQLQSLIDSEASLRDELKEAHLWYIDKRNQFMSKDVKLRLEALGYYEGLQDRGIGGIANFTRIRCLHTYYAAHLIKPNVVGRLLDDHWALEGRL